MKMNSKPIKDMSDLSNDSQLVNKNIPTRKQSKRQRLQAAEEEDFSELIGLYKGDSKKKKSEAALDFKTPRQNLIEVVEQQLVSRNQLCANVLEKLLDVVKQLEADHEMLKENEQKFEQIANVFMKCIKQCSSAQKQHLKEIKDLHASFKNEVEGLLTRGGMKPDDRPMWFDVYRAFPPLTEPKFAQPKPDIKPIRQILYKEDVIRAKFHAKGNGFGAVNMLNPAGETHTKKLVQQYEKLELEGVPESELIDKSVSAIGLERPQLQDTPKFSSPNPNPNSVTAQTLSEVDIKNIFKE